MALESVVESSDVEGAARVAGVSSSAVDRAPVERTSAQKRERCRPLVLCNAESGTDADEGTLESLFGPGVLQALGEAPAVPAAPVATSCPPPPDGGLAAPRADSPVTTDRPVASKALVSSAVEGHEGCGQRSSRGAARAAGRGTDGTSDGSRSERTTVAQLHEIDRSVWSVPASGLLRGCEWHDETGVPRHTRRAAAAALPVGCSAMPQPLSEIVPGLSVVRGWLLPHEQDALLKEIEGGDFIGVGYNQAMYFGAAMPDFALSMTLAVQRSASRLLPSALLRRKPRESERRVSSTASLPPSGLL